MRRLVRFSLIAALAVGVTISAATGRAANPYGATAAYPSAAYSSSPNGSQLTLVSATEDQPQAADPSSVRLADPHSGIVPAEQSAAQMAPKPVVQKPSTLQPAKTVYTAPRPATAAAPRPAPRVSASAPRPAVIATPRPATPRAATPNYYSQRNGVQLTASVAVEPARPEGVLMPVAPTSQSPSPTMASPPPSPEMDASIGGCPTCQSCGCDSCCGFCAGLEYLYLRPHFADDAAFERLTTTTNPTTVTEVNQLVNFDEPYNSDYHFFVGYHNSCGDEFRLGYWHLSDDGNRTGTASGDFLAGDGVAFQAPGGTELTAAGETVTATSHMTLNMYDFDDVKRIDLASFGCACCPEWDVHWSYGLRVVDFKHTVDIQDPFETINNGSYFVGGGPKLGLEVRRQFGHSKFSAYVCANAALLLGEERGRSTTTTPGVLQTAVDMNVANGAEIVPDFNIAVGVTWQPWCHTTFTGGWMFEDFGNLGTAGATTCTTCSTTSGNIGGGDLSFDGLFVRAEHCF